MTISECLNLEHHINMATTTKQCVLIVIIALVGST